MKHNIRGTIGYKVRMWYYRITKKDVKNTIYWIGENIILFIALIVIFMMIFFVPAIFH